VFVSNEKSHDFRLDDLLFKHKLFAFSCPGPIKTTTCAADDSESFLSSKCNGKRKCKIEASNDVFGDPCVGTFKYVKMVYHCADKNSFEVEEPDEDENEDSSSKSE